MFLRVFYLCLSLALFVFPVALANEHAKCYCVVNSIANKCLTAKACDIYRRTMTIFEEDDPQNVNTTMIFQVCATIAPKDGGRMRYVSGFGGKEFKNACDQAKSVGGCEESNGDVGSECD
ncbi:uncharacterized protein CTRU02_205201 [Colletotrichum truncatum]|uniref:Uncharacterized protein n=1 Tax=Colletotrichum truncatum TaxID=5467 RepID=A0ACC3Z3B9_COLTU|nr:uncharacterized protein CTRU02_05977 [Colletotrichum truncatum]KAF6793105.1 hypothetical protein CTRU02_05977 [Colletotrichum truncatum]